MHKEPFFNILVIPIFLSIITILLATGTVSEGVQNSPLEISVLDVSSKTDPAILKTSDQIVEVIVEKKDKTNLSQFVNDLESKDFSLGNYEYLKMPKSEITKLDKMDSVKRIELVKEYSLLIDTSAPLIKADRFWSNGYNGSGVKVCIIDSGIKKSHPALASRVVAEKDFVTNDADGNNPDDSDGHGTHVAGIVASTDQFSKGIGFGASLLNAKVFDSSTGKAPTDAVKSAIDWCVSENANVLSLSLGGKDEINDGSDVLSNSLDIASDKGKVVVVAAGNSGPNGNKDCRTNASATGATSSICSPGTSHKAITVGSTQSGKLGTEADKISGFSSRGPTGDGRLKPDLTAPGEIINSTDSSGGSFVTNSGTSMSAPHVAGLAALMLSLRPNLTPEEIKAILMNTAIDLGTSKKDNIYGSGRVNASRVFDEIHNTINGSLLNDTYISHNIYVPNATGEIRATLYWPENYSLHNDLDLYLLDPLGGVRKSSTSEYRVEESVSLSNPFMGGNWKLQVYGSNVSGLQPYLIASNIKPAEQLNLVQDSTSNTTFHKVGVNPNTKRVILNLDWNLTSDDFDIELYNSTGSLVNSSSTKNANYDQVSLDINGAEFFVAKLVLNSSQPTVKYSITSNQNISQKLDLPLFFSQAGQSPGTPIYGTDLKLSSIWHDRWGISSVFFESNFTGVLSNSTATKLNSSHYGFIINSSDLDANKTISWRFLAKDGQGFWNNSMILKNFTVQKATPSIELYLNESKSNRTYERGETANITAFINATGLDLILESNFTGISSKILENKNLVSNITTTENLLGVYNLTAYSKGNQNYTSSSSTLFLRVEDTLYPKIKKLIIRPLKPDVFRVFWETTEKTSATLYYGLSASYGQTLIDTVFSNLHNVTISGLNESTKYHFRINLTDIANNTRSFANLTFTTGSIEKINLTANQKKNIFFSKVNATLDFLVNSSLENIKINMSLLKINPIGVNMTARQLDKFLDIEPEQNLTEKLSYVIIKMSYTDDEIQNISEDNLRLFLWNSSHWVSFDPPLGGVNKTGKYVWANRTGFSTYSFGAKFTPSLTLSSSPGWSINKGTESAVTCSGNSTANLKLYRDNTEVSNPDKQTLSNGPYSYVCNNTEDVNFTSVSLSNTLVISTSSASPSPTSTSQASTPSTGSSTPSTGTQSGANSDSPKANQRVQEEASISKILTAKEDSSQSKPIELVSPEELVQKGLDKIQILLTGDISASDAKVEAKIFEKLPSIDDYGKVLTVLPRADQKALKVIQITPTTQLKDKIKEANITFNLNKTEADQIGPNNIVLLRFSNSSWQELQTSLINQTSEKYIYTSVSPGFSIFVATNKDAPNSTLLEPLTSSSQETSEDSSKSAATGLALGSTNSDWVFVVAPIVLIVLVAIIFFRKKSGKRGEIPDDVKTKPKKKPSKGDIGKEVFN